MRRLGLLSAAIAVTLCSALFSTAAAAETEIKDVAYHRLDTGVTFLWANSAGVWQNGLEPEKTASFTNTFSLPSGAKNVRVAAYSPYAEEGEAGYFNFNGGKNYAWNRTVAAVNGDEYDVNYYAYAASPLSVGGADSYDPQTGSLRVSYNVTFRAAGGQPYDIKGKLAAGEKQEIYDLLGSPSSEIAEKMRLLDPASELYNANVKGYMFFQPIVISYDMEEECEITQEEAMEQEPVVPEPETDGEARLSVVPAITYEGHTVKAEDVSVFTVDGVIYSAHRMYDEGLAVSSISTDSASGAQAVKTGKISADVTFPKAGEYMTYLKIRMKNGMYLRDEKAVEVKKTPDITARLGGTQKQNRKQTLSVTIATHPDRPLKQLWIELETEQGEQRVRLDDLIEREAENTSVVSEEIKTRPISLISSSPYFTELELQFLTKNDEKKNYRYRIYARDGGGNSTETEAVFEVRPDMAPAAAVTTEPTHIREEGSDFAIIDVADSSATDGDPVVRSWYLKADGEEAWRSADEISEIEDLSFGSKKTLRHKKYGVGKLRYALEVKEVWTEETLEEYISPEDYLSGYAEAETEVINIAPRVAIYPIEVEKAELLMVARNDEEEAAFRQAAKEARGRLLEKDIDADITVKKLNPVRLSMSANALPTAVNTFSTSAYGFYGDGTILEKNWYMADSSRFFTLEGTWNNTATAAPYLASPQQPAYIAAYDLISGSPLWKTEVTLDRLNLGSYKQGGMAQEDSEKYLFLRNDKKTLIYDKDTGAYLTETDIAVGDDSYSRGNWIYTLKADGIYGINTTTAASKKVFTTDVCLRASYCDDAGYSKIYNKRVDFLGQNGGRLFRYSFDPASESCAAREIVPDTKISGKYAVLGFGTDGKVAAAQKDNSVVFVFDKNCRRLITLSGWENERGQDAVCAFDGEGSFDYIVAINNTYSQGSKKTRYGIKAAAYPIDGGTPLYFENVRAVGSYGTSGNGTDAERTVYAFAAADGEVILCTGDWATSISDGSSIGSYYYYSFSQIKFDFNAGSSSRAIGGSAFYGDMQIGGKISEYGKRTEDYWISAYSWGHAGYAYSDGLNGQSAKVSVLPASTDSMIARLADANIGAADELDGASAVLVSDKSVIGEKTQNLLNETGSTLIIGDGSADSITDYFLRNGKVTEAYTAVPTASEAAICKEYILEPDALYYFEYAAKGADEITAPEIKANITEGVSEESRGESVYRVTAVMSENFEDARTETFFSGIDAARMVDGKYRAAFQELNTGKGNNSRTLTDSSSLRFTVPEGKKAILSFDYDIDLYGSCAWYSAHMTIRDEAGNASKWQAFVPQDGAGHYTHPTFLPEGVNTIEFYSSDYSTRYFNSHFIIDNLQVTFVEEGEASAEVAAETEIVQSADAWSYVSGSFRTPKELIDYREIAAEYVEGKPGEAKYTALTASSDRSKTYTFEIPAGKTAAYIRLNTQSSPCMVSKSEKDVTYTIDSYTWVSSAQNSREYDWYYNIGTEKEISLYNRSGTQTFKESSTNTWAQGDYTRIEAALIDGSCALTENMRYFVADGDGDGENELYAENDRLRGARFKIKLGEGESTVRDLRLYCIKDGVKLYPEEVAWETEGCTLEKRIIDVPQVKEEPPMVYQKGEIVKYGVHYSDFEADPSKRQYWRYTHVPFNDGLHPQAGEILSAPIESFETDGKYTVEHWQEDSTGNETYDKLSNVAEIVFYIEGGGNAPWIESITTAPKKILPGDKYTLAVRADDLDKDVLTLKTEIYKDRKPIYSETRSGIAADGEGRYPTTVLSDMPSAEEGTYTVVCTVSDETGTGIGTYKFTARHEGSIQGAVDHTEEWEKRRAEKQRPKDYFYAGEKFVLTAETTGNPKEVRATISGYEQFAAELTRTASVGDNQVYEGGLWHADMASLWRNATALPLTFVFDALYPNGRRITSEVTVFIDNIGGALRVHRTY